MSLEEESPPPGFEEDEDDRASRSTELPVVVMDAGEQAGAAPAHRLLHGRVAPGWVLGPAYALVVGSSLLAIDASIGSNEWSVVVVVIAWGQLYVWIWFYRIAWSYRRPLLEIFSLAASLLFAAGLALACYDRAAPQQTLVDGALAPRDALTELYWAGHILWGVCVALFAHAVYLGRGYRRKKIEPSD
jgi:hypothetical protein